MDRPSGEELLSALEAGDVRVAEPRADGTWQVNAWVKEEILSLFRASGLVAPGTADERRSWPFIDKSAFPVRGFELEQRVRLVPGGSAVRRGAHIGENCILMPPCYVNVGAHVGAGTMVDSHALVGSCAQVGERVHVSAGAQIGGVLEPVGARPVIVEDDVLVGGLCGLFEGVLVRAGAVLAAGVVLTAATRVFDLVHEHERTTAPGAAPEIPAGAVVIPGTRPARGAWAREQGLSSACALIVKYRDASTDRATALEDALR